MRKIKEILRLALLCGLSHRQISRSVNLGKGTVGDYLRRARAADLTWEAVEKLSALEVEQQLFASARRPPETSRPTPCWREVHEEFQKKHVTLSLLWQEYKADEPGGYEYSRFCDLYGEWKGELDVCMRQEHKAGEKLFVDYAGSTAEVVDAKSGEIREAQIFVAVLGASNYTYAEATWSQDLKDWVSSHMRALEHYGGVPEIVVPDNLKSGVNKACRYEPDVNRTYTELSEHYGFAVIPARPRKPRDKAKVEAGVLQVSRWVLACLRNQTFFSLADLNREIQGLVQKLNDKPLKVLKEARRALFERLERPVLSPLPEQRYEIARWQKAKPGIDYHVEVDKHYYSVPYQLVRHRLEVRLTARTVEVFHNNERRAVHVRSYRAGHHTTVREHMPKSHQGYLEWTPKRLVRWASKMGPSTAGLVEAILSSRPHPQQGYRSCLGLLRLENKYNAERLEAACQRALAVGGLSYKSVRSILENGLDRQPLPEQASDREDSPLSHDNIRGRNYYR